jgi:hypothetical protein
MFKLTLDVLDVEQGIATVAKVCPGCGEDHEIQVPLDDVGTEKVEATMCVDCIAKFCND